MREIKVFHKVFSICFVKDEIIFFILALYTLPKDFNRMLMNYIKSLTFFDKL